jgi:glycogen(starch) synthase
VELIFQGEGRIDHSHWACPLLNPDGTPKRYSQQELPDGDLLVCHDWHGVVATNALWQEGMPMIWMCHLPISWDIGDYHDVACRFSHEMEFTSALRANAVACVSSAVGQQINQTYPFTVGKTMVVANGVDTSFFTANTSPSSNGKRILYVGRYQAQKGFDLIPAIMKKVWARDPEVSLEIIGIGPMDKEVAAALHPPAPNRVRWHSFGPREAVRSAYERAAAVLMPSRLEPFGLVAVEAMASGRPVIAGRTGGLIDIVTPGETGELVPVDDSEGYADAICNLVSDQGRLDRYGAAARSRVVQNFSLDERMEAVCAMYARVIAAHSKESR